MVARYNTKMWIYYGYSAIAEKLSKTCSAVSNILDSNYVNTAAKYNFGGEMLQKYSKNSFLFPEKTNKIQVHT